MKWGRYQDLGTRVPGTKYKVCETGACKAYWGTSEKPVSARHTAMQGKAGMRQEKLVGARFSRVWRLLWNWIPREMRSHWKDPSTSEVHSKGLFWMPCGEKIKRVMVEAARPVRSYKRTPALDCSPPTAHQQEGGVSPLVPTNVLWERLYLLVSGPAVERQEKLHYTTMQPTRTLDNKDWHTCTHRASNFLFFL